MLEEITKRIDLIRKANNRPMVQAIEMENCRIDILYWFKNYAWTDKNTSLFNSSDP